ncbi:hypothetical protein PPYR_07053 [Photinus pyralis]|uniref:NADP-dependent oxidoreductase domain-containing protein n=1 Tax=Photinus pyralis TaxID=7054 RepID=A0A1Y1KY10_PHOPY|nr:1,5-anhydro-D-fructose reductase-like [Photinus pyralis]XP_031339488.1 1,5-anhydro-D-fructose reductase-like [Photinus pyralis]KAB0799173.1 hypothetical protein PPYR_07053 [Photinus pyralis]
MAAVPTVKLNNGVQIPILGLGTWQSPESEVKQAVMDAIDIGYRHFDCAHIYENQKAIGEAISAKISQGVVKRSDLFITSKLWNTFHRPGSVEPILRSTLKEMNLEYFDLYLIHWPFGFKEGDTLYPAGPDGFEYSDYDYTETWAAMEEVHKKGLARAIGVSNFNKHQIERVLAVCTITPAMNQVECHPYFNQKKLKEFCESKTITITAYSPLGSPGIQTDGKRKSLLNDPVLKDIGTKYHKTAAQIAIRYQMERGIVVIPKSVHKKRLIENFSVLDFSLSSEDIAKIDALGTDQRVVTFDEVRSHRFYPFSDDY